MHERTVPVSRGRKASYTGVVADNTPAPPDDHEIKVAWLIKGLGAGGAEHLLVSLARGIDRDRFAVSAAYVLDWKTALLPALEHEGVDAHCLGVKDGRDLRWVLRLRRFLKDGRFDVVHVHSPLVAAASRAVVLTMRTRPRIISTEHNSWASHGRITRLLNRVTYRMDAAHIAVSAKVVASLPDHLAARTEVLVHGVDLDAVHRAVADREAARQELGLGPGQVAVCTVANLRWQKGYPDLMLAAKAIIDEGHDVVFLAVGQGPLEQELRQRHDELGLGDRFRFLGYRADALRVLGASDVFALASIHEGYPLAVMEAMAAGLPIVATNAGGVPDAVRDGEEGLVVESKRPDLLADALRKVVSDSSMRQRFGAAALARSASFSIDAALHRIEELYESASSP
jgi:glycosyltransferase involved in cell wall biosynthesis